MDIIIFVLMRVGAVVKGVVIEIKFLLYYYEFM